jgi:hypothetical protein
MGAIYRAAMFVVVWYVIEEHQTSLYTHRLQAGRGGHRNQ